MSAELELLVSKVKKLSIEELLTIQETIITELRHKTMLENPVISTNLPGNTSIFLPKLSPQEIEAELAEIFTPEELAEINAVDLSKLPLLPAGVKTLSEIVNEDREDRV